MWFGSPEYKIFSAVLVLTYKHFLQTIFIMVVYENTGQKLWILSHLPESSDVPVG